ncbi:MAG: TetR/AcrR family transcriptional regulator [Hyphomonadaceae bacterium]
MSDNGIHIGIDRRVARTRVLLADALISLGAERGLEAIEISDLVEEAGIARSTFYAHFAGKDDFLIRSFINMLAATEDAHRAAYPDRTEVLPSKALFHHVSDARDFALRIAKSEIFPHQMAAGEAKLREIAETNIARSKPQWTSEQAREAAIYIAGGFIGLLRWWMQSGLRQTPEQMQAAFARLTNSVLGDV